MKTVEQTATVILRHYNSDTINACANQCGYIHKSSRQIWWLQ